MGRVWIITSFALMIAAAVFLLRESYDAAFVAGALGAVAWFLNLRVALRAKMVEATETDEEASDVHDEE